MNRVKSNGSRVGATLFAAAAVLAGCAGSTGSGFPNSTKAVPTIRSSTVTESTAVASTSAESTVEAPTIPASTLPQITDLPSTTAAPSSNTVCSNPGQRDNARGLVCGNSAFGQIWLDSPFSVQGDGVALNSGITDQPDTDGSTVTIADATFFTFGMLSPWRVKDTQGNRLWCTSYQIVNASNVMLSYGSFTMALVTPSGSLLPATIPFGYDPLPGSGQIAPTGSGGSYICFDQQAASGRYGLAYQPIYLGEQHRAIVYFDV
jgi:hypothetical protein